MNLSEGGESRIRGYLFMLESSLRVFMKRELADDAVREVESHIRDRVREAEPMPNERDALNRLLEEIGSPHRLARAYSAEIAVDEAVASGRVSSIARALVAVGRNTAEGFAAALGLLIGYLVSIAFLLIAIMKPIFPDNVGVRWRNGEFVGAGWELWLEPGTVVTHGWWLALVSLVVGALLLRATHRGARRYLHRVSARRQARARLRDSETPR
jgi:hypothetical protein